MAQLGNTRRVYIVTGTTPTYTVLAGEQTNSVNRTAEAIEVSDKSSDWAQFISGKKALIHYIVFTGALIIAILGIFILIYNKDLLKALGWLFGFVLVQDGLFTLLNALLFARRSNRKGWWMLVVLAVALLTLGVTIFLNPWWDSPSLLMKVIGGALLFSAFVSALRLVWVWPFKNEKEGDDDGSDR